MVDARHKAQTIAEGIHTPVSFEYANAAARLAAGPFESYDKNKFALQLDTNQIYVLIDTSPIVWSSVSGPGISGDLDMDGYDIIDVGTVDGVDVSAHAGRHEEGGADAIEISDLGTAEVNVLLVLQPDGVGGVVWSVPPGGGDVVGPAGATDNAVALFDAGTGKVIKNSLVTIDGSGNISTPGTVDGYALGAEFYDINAQLDILGGILGGDLSGTLPNPTVVDLTITSEEQGSVLYFDGSNWVQLPPGEDGYALITHDTGANPTWGGVASSSPITSVFGRVGDVVAVVDDYSASQIDNDSTVPGEQVSDALEYLDGYVASVAQDVADIGTMVVGGDLSGNLPNPSVVDLSITGEEQGSVLYFDGGNWVQLPPGSDGYALITHDTGANPTWEEVASSAPVTSVFGRVGDVVAVVDDYSASQIDNDSTVSGGQVSDALEYLDGYVDHAIRHEDGGPDEIEISNLGTSEVNTLLVLQPDGIGGVVWSVPSGGGDVVGPAGATDNAVALFDAGTGKVIKNSLVTIDGSGNISTPGTVDGYSLGSEFYDINAQLDILGGPLGGDLSGTLPNPSVVDLTITAEEQGSVLYFDGSNWVQLPPGEDGYALITHDTGASPTWGEVATTAPVTSVFSRVGDVVAGIDDYSSSQIDNDSTVTGEQVSDALEYLDGYISSHVTDLNNPHQTSIGNIAQGTLAELNLAISDATLDDISGTRTPTAHATSHEEGEADAIDGYQIGINYVPVNYVAPINPIIGEHIAAIDDALASSGLVDSVFGRIGDVVAAIDDYSASQIDNDSTVSGEQVSDALEYLDGYISGHVGDLNNPHQTSVGNIGSGTLAELNLAISDATLDDISGTRTPTAHATSHEEGETDAIDGYQVQLNYVPVNYVAPVNPIIGEHIAAIDDALASSGLVDSVFGRIGDVVAAIDDYSASQIDNDSTVTGGQVSDALEYLDGYIKDHSYSHENGGGDEIEISNLGTSEFNNTLVLMPDGVGGVVWSVPSGGGDVSGPAGATDNAVALFDAGTGKVIKNSLVTIDGSGNISTPGTVDGYALGSEFYDINAQLDILGGILGGDLSGTLPNPSVVNLTISGEEQGSVLYFDGANWVQLPPGEDGYALITHDTGANPTWGEVATTAPVTSVFTRVGDVVAGVDDYSASQIDNDSTVTGEQVSDALEYLDGYVNHGERHEYDGDDPVDGYQIGLVYSPVNYDPPGTDIIGEHIANIDSALGEIVDSGYVVGPAIATDTAIVRFDGITGELVQNSGVLVDNSDNISGVESLATGSLPAQTGAIRLTNNEGIYWAGTGGTEFPGDRQFKLAVTIPADSIVGDIGNDLWVRITHISLPDAMITSGGAQALSATGTDLAASLDEIGSTRIPLYVVRCDLNATPANSRVQIWVRRQDVSDSVDTDIWLWWGSETATAPAVSAPYGRNDVFGSTTGTGTPPDGFGVWLFDEDPAGSAPQYIDHTGGGHDATVNSTVTRVDLMDVRGAQTVAEAGWITTSFTWAPGTGDFAVLWAGDLSVSGWTQIESTPTITIGDGSCNGLFPPAYYPSGPGIGSSPNTFALSRNGDSCLFVGGTSSNNNAGFVAVNVSMVNPQLVSHFTEGGTSIRTFIAFVDTALNSYWIRAFHDSLTAEASFFSVGDIESAGVSVLNVRGILVDPTNHIVLGDVDYPLVGNATGSITFNVDGYEIVSMYDGYVDVVNNDIRKIKTATFNEWPTLTTDEDGYVTVDFTSYQKATIDLNDEASVYITLNEPVGPGNFMLILKQGSSTATTSITWVTEGSHGLYGPYGDISYSKVLDLVTLIGLAYDGNDWFGTSSQPLEQILAG